MRLALAVVALCCVGIASATLRNGIGYNTDRPPLATFAYPHKPTFDDTRTIAPRGIREARLVCDRFGPIFRVITCEIHTFDTCGNIEGESGNHTRWVVKVESTVLVRDSQHVSPVIWLRRGVARFYFTPMSVGHYTITVSQPDSFLLPPLRTGNPMTFITMVHDSTMKCTGYDMNGATRPVQHFIWGLGSARNERKPIVGIETATSDHSNIFADVARKHNAAQAALQQATNRMPVQPVAPELLRDLPRTDNNAFGFCDYVQRMA